MLASRRPFFAIVLLLAVMLAGCGGGAASEGPGSATPATAARPVPAGPEERGGASYYADRFQGRATASGEPYDKTELTAAHRTLPFGAIVLVTRVSDGSSVEVRINDRGPHVRGRIVDLSRRAAEAIGLVRVGVAEVALKVLSLPPEKKTKKRRKSSAGRAGVWQDER
jgi:rare lipoprotein A